MSHRNRFAQPPPSAGQPAVLLPDLHALASEIPLEQAHVLAAALADADVVLRLRIAGRASQAVDAAPPGGLLTAEDVAARLSVSKANVYRRAKTDLRQAAREIGPGQVRFDPAEVERFIRSRRR
jgi:predicted DNA-binding transcriptional regulator AlpA